MHITRALAQAFDAACFVNDGTSDATNGGQTGLFSDATITAVNAAAGNTSVAALGEEDFLNCLAALPAGVLQRGAEVWMNPNLILKAMLIKSNGLRCVKTALETDTGGAAFSVCGFPLHGVAVASATETAGSKIAVAGLPDAYCAGIRKEFSIEQSPHVVWNKLSVTFRAYGRARGILKDASGFRTLKLAAA